MLDEEDATLLCCSTFYSIISGKYLAQNFIRNEYLQSINDNFFSDKKGYNFFEKRSKKLNTHLHFICIKMFLKIDIFL